MSGPPPPPGSGFWQITGTMNGLTPWQIGLHLGIPQADLATYGNVRDLHASLDFAMQDLLGGVMSSSARSSLSRLHVIGSVDEVVHQGDLVVHGGRGEGEAAAIAVPCVENLIAKGRGRFGRFFLPAPAFNDVGPLGFGFQLTPAAYSVYSDHVAQFLDAVNTTISPPFLDVFLAVLARHEHGVPLPAARIDAVSHITVAHILGTQVRRMRRVRR